MSKKYEDDNKALGAGNIAATGAGLVAIKKSAPLVTGREKFYHGTTEDLVKKIKKTGLINPNKTGTKDFNTQELKGISKAMYRRSRNYVYMTPNKAIARGVAAQSDAGGIKKLKEKLMNAGDLLNYKKRVLNPFSSKGVVTGSIPTWKPEYKKHINPEMAYIKGNINRLNMPKPLKKLYLNRINKQLGPAFKEVAPEYIKGSKKFIPFTKELGQYIKARPGKFAIGSALGMVGAAAAGLGIKNMISNVTGHSKQAAYDRIREEAFIDELNKIAFMNPLAPVAGFAKPLFSSIQHHSNQLGLALKPKVHGLDLVKNRPSLGGVFRGAANDQTIRSSIGTMGHKLMNAASILT